MFQLTFESMIEKKAQTAERFLNTLTSEVESVFSAIVVLVVPPVSLLVSLPVETISTSSSRSMSPSAIMMEVRWKTILIII